MNGTFSLVFNGAEVFPTASGWQYGWNKYVLGTADADDAVAGASSACVWNYDTDGGFYYRCLYNDLDHLIRKGYWIDGLTLAKFKTTVGGTTTYTWRLIVIAILVAGCTYYDQNYIKSGWYWEMTSTTKDCHFDGTETWTAYTPSPSVSIYCDGGLRTVSRTEFCTGTLSLTSVVDS
tara:strand:- start:206 stop:736 length:531 start_codon:yes stop_codon:yes gene_type:complete